MKPGLNAWEPDAVCTELELEILEFNRYYASYAQVQVANVSVVLDGKQYPVDQSPFLALYIYDTYWDGWLCDGREFSDMEDVRRRVSQLEL